MSILDSVSEAVEDFSDDRADMRAEKVVENKEYEYDQSDWVDKKPQEILKENFELALDYCADETIPLKNKLAMVKEIEATILKSSKNHEFSVEQIILQLCQYLVFNEINCLAKADIKMKQFKTNDQGEIPKAIDMFITQELVDIRQKHNRKNCKNMSFQSIRKQTRGFGPSPQM